MELSRAALDLTPCLQSCHTEQIDLNTNVPLRCPSNLNLPKIPLRTPCTVIYRTVPPSNEPSLGSVWEFPTWSGGSRVQAATTYASQGGHSQGSAASRASNPMHTPCTYDTIRIMTRATRDQDQKAASGASSATVALRSNLSCPQHTQHLTLRPRSQPRNGPSLLQLDPNIERDRHLYEPQARAGSSDAPRSHELAEVGRADVRIKQPSCPSPTPNRHGNSPPQWPLLSPSDLTSSGTGSPASAAAHRPYRSNTREHSREK